MEASDPADHLSASDGATAGEQHQRQAQHRVHPSMRIAVCIEQDEQNGTHCCEEDHPEIVLL